MPLNINHKRKNKPKRSELVMPTNYRRWSQHPYQGEVSPPIGNPKPGNWPMFFIKRDVNGEFLDPFQQKISWQIQDPNTIDWNAEMNLFMNTLSKLTPEQIRIAHYWGTGEVISKLSPMIFRLGEKYRVGSPRITQMQAYFHAATHDAFVMSWFFKYLWDVARPNQYNQKFSTVVVTPRFPSYPSAHATVAGCAEVLLSSYFPLESSNFHKIIEECSTSRLYAGVHFNIDNVEGLRLGRQIGHMVIRFMQVQLR